MKICKMEANLQQITYLTVLLLVSLHITKSVPVKPNARPVHEVINEQSRIDEKIRPPIKPGHLPYGNPLAGNSRQNAKLHAQNQQAMFNAERVRQHRAQLQRWTKAPQQVDSYMKAYQESQESHQLVLEQQQTKLRDNRQAPVTKAPVARQNLKDNAKRSQKIPQSADTTRITKADAVLKSEKNRSHRSFGSVDYHQYLQPKRYQTVYVSPGPTYDQGVTIKPNGNIGLSHLQSSPEESKLYTQAIPSKTHYVYPKQYNQMQSYQSAQDIDTLNALLKKAPTDQLTELSALLNSDTQSSDESHKDTLNTPIDLYFYLKDKTPTLPQHYDHSLYAQIPPNYAGAYIKDHTPITEEIDDVEDPNKNPRLKTYALQTVLATQDPEEHIDTTTTKSNNYYKVEVASQTISAPYKPSKHYYYKGHEEAKPTYQALHYAPEPTYYSHKDKTEGDLSERYLHHNAQHVGIQHLAGDGTGVSAYGDDNVSISCLDTSNGILSDACNKSRKARSVLEVDPFLIPNKIQPLTESPISITTPSNDTQSPKSESYIRHNSYNNPINHHNIRDTFLTTPNFPVGVATDFHLYDDYEDPLPPRFGRPYHGPEKYETYDDEEEFDDYNSDYNQEPAYYDQRPNFRKPSLYAAGTSSPFQTYAPTAGYNQNRDLQGSFSRKFKKFHGFPNIASPYGVPQYGISHGYGIPESYSPPQSYGPSITYNIPQSFAEPAPVYSPPKHYGSPIGYGEPVRNIEPVYMLTQSQLKSLIGDQNYNIQHFDVFQTPKHHQRPQHYPRKHKKQYHRKRNYKRNLKKLHKLHLL